MADKKRKMAGTSKFSFTQLHIKGGKAKLREKLNAEARRHGYSSIQAGINSGDLALTAERKKAGFKPPEPGSYERKSMQKNPHHYLNIQKKDKSSVSAASRKALRISARKPSKKRKK